MLGKPSILSLFPNSFNHSIKHEHSCKILYESDEHKVIKRWCQYGYLSFRVKVENDAEIYSIRLHIIQPPTLQNINSGDILAVLKDN